MKKYTSLVFLVLAGQLFAAQPSPVLYTIVPGADVILRDDYGYILINGGDKDNPEPRYILGAKGAGKIVDTKSLEEFAQALSKIPKEKTLFQYDSCTVLRSYGLTEQQVSAFEKTLKRSGLKLSEEPRITCYCEALGKR